jgi:hypothetical protein
MTKAPSSAVGGKGSGRKCSGPFCQAACAPISDVHSIAFWPCQPMIKQKIDLETTLKSNPPHALARHRSPGRADRGCLRFTREEIVGIIERRVEELHRRRDSNDLEGQMEVQALHDAAARLRAPPEAVVVNKARMPLNRNANF